jgi:hypothetical protein
MLTVILRELIRVQPVPVMGTDLLFRSLKAITPAALGSVTVREFACNVLVGARQDLDAPTVG